MRGKDASGEGVKRVGNYTYYSKDVIGKGYSSTVYRGLNDTNGTACFIQDRPLLSKSLTLRA